MMIDNTEANLMNIYNNFFSKNNCTNIFPIVNKWAKADALLQSGTTSVLIEYKRRNLSIKQFQSSMIERKKYNNLKRIACGLDAPALYVIEYDEILLIFQLKESDKYNWQMIPSKINSYSDEIIDKEVAMIDYKEADFIISKRTWNKGTFKQLQSYLLKQN